MPASGEARRSRRRRSVLAGIALVLACLTIVLATTSLWVHQVVLNTDRFTSLVTNVISEPAVIDPISSRVSEQVVVALGVEQRIADRLPDAAKPLARALAVQIQDAIDKRLQQVLANPKIQTALLATVRFAHEHMVNLLRGDTTAVTIVDGYIQLNVFPIVGAALTELQSMGLIPADIQLPDLSADDAPAVLAQRLQDSLGVTLPPNFGTIPLIQAARLETAQGLVQAFDVLVVVLIVLAIALVALALWLARDRRRMVVYLALAIIVAFILSRFAIRGIESFIVSQVANPDMATGLREILDAVVANLGGVTTIVIVVTAIVAVAAYLLGRPAWFVRLTSGRAPVIYAPATTGAAGATPGAATVDSPAATTADTASSATSASAADPAAAVATTRVATPGAAEPIVPGAEPAAASTGRPELRPLVREHRSTAEKAGIAAIAFAIAWLALGIEIALLGAALVGAWLIIVRLLADESDDGGGTQPGAGSVVGR
jgi:hypothetical protein